jgi:hypothetical protein
VVRHIINQSGRIDILGALIAAQTQHDAARVLSTACAPACHTFRKLCSFSTTQ